MLTTTAIVTDNRLTPVAAAVEAAVTFTADKAAIAKQFVSIVRGNTRVSKARLTSAQAILKQLLEVPATAEGTKFVDDLLSAQEKPYRLSSEERKTASPADLTAALMAAKVASYLRQIWGAVQNRRLDERCIADASSFELLTQAARAGLAGDDETGTPAINWRGEVKSSEPLADRKARKAAERITEDFAGKGADPQTVAKLREQAAALARDKAVAEQLAAMDEQCRSAAQKLVEKMGKVNALSFATKLVATLTAMQ